MVNQLLAEAWDAQKGVGFYAELTTSARSCSSPRAPSCRRSRQAQPVGGDEYLDLFNLVASVGGARIAASVSFEFPEVSAERWVASEISSMLPRRHRT